MAEQKVETKAEDKIIRILSTDIEGKMSVYAGLTKIKGISWSFSNAICNKLNLDKRKKIGSLSQDEIKKITDFIKNPELPSFLLNRERDPEMENGRHLVGSDLELQKEFDIKRLKKIRSYRGLRHSAKLPLRGQRTKSNFRRNKAKGVGIKKKKK